MIPKKIYQTHKNYNLSDNIKKLIYNLITVNPEFNYTFMDNDECYEFIKANFDDEFVKMYENLPLDIMRADVWRIAVVYINGGIYCDCDVHCIQNLAPLIYNEELVLFTEESGGTSNFFFAASPKHPALKKALDLMVDKKETARDLDANLMVQDFGMYIFDIAVSDVKNKKQLSYLESRKWLDHLFYSSWRKSEETYINASINSKPVTFITTFHQHGYDLYGKVWIESFIKNVTTKRKNINAIVYSHNISNLDISHPQITIVDYEKTIPKHAEWKKEYIKKTHHSDFVKSMTLRFSHKGFVIQDGLSKIKEGYLIWTDGDVVFKDADYTNFPDCLFEKEDAVVACQIEDGNHVESGVLIFNMEHPDIQLFTKHYINNYSVDKVLSEYSEPYDGHVARKSLITSGVEHINLNKIYGRNGIQSDPNETFLHPEIASRFVHNIGVTGKRSYEDWDNVKTKDNIFKVLEWGGFKVFSDETRKAVSLRDKRKKSVQ